MIPKEIFNDSVFTKKQVLLITILFFAVAFWGILNHEIWLDEAQHWLISRDSHSLSELFKNTRYEGHPILWNVLLYFISFFTHKVIAFQLFHICISTISVWIFLTYSPFSKSFSILFILGYFCFYEYSVISRNYSIGILFLFLICACWQQRHQHYFKLFLLLSFAANTHLETFILSLILAAIIIYERFWKLKTIAFSRSFYAGLIVFILFSILSLIQIQVPPDHPYHFEFSVSGINSTISAITKSFFPIPDFFRTHFWNSYLLLDVSKIVFISLLPVLIFMLIILTSDKKIPFLFFISSFSLIILFLFLSSRTAVRHFGFLYFSFIITLWIGKYYSGETNEWNSFFVKLKSKYGSFILTILLSVQAIAGITAFLLDWKRPFSNGKITANYIREERLDQYKIAAKYCGSTTIDSYLDRQVFYPEIGDSVSFCKWNLQLNHYDRTKFIEYFSHINQPTLLIFNEAIQDTDKLLNSENFSVSFLKQFEDGNLQMENFYLYLIEPK